MRACSLMKGVQEIEQRDCRNGAECDMANGVSITVLDEQLIAHQCRQRRM